MASIAVAPSGCRLPGHTDSPDALRQRTASPSKCWNADDHDAHAYSDPLVTAGRYPQSTFGHCRGTFFGLQPHYLIQAPSVLHATDQPCVELLLAQAPFNGHEADTRLRLSDSDMTALPALAQSLSASVCETRLTGAIAHG